MKKIFLLLTVISCCILSAKAQDFGYDETEELGNGLFKVKSGSYYGIIDKDDKVIVSIEYQDFIFEKGKALLTKDNTLWGIVDSLGVITELDGKYKVNPKYRNVYDGFIPVSVVVSNLISLSSKWGFIDDAGKPFIISQKMKGAKSNGKNGLTLFDDVIPFVDDVACVFLKKEGWKHLDSSGKERYILDDDIKALFRSSVYKGECIIVTEDGIKQYQEDGNSRAVVRRVLASSASLIDTIHEKNNLKLIYKEGVLTLDSLMRATKFENEADSIVLIEKPRKVVVKQPTIPVDTLSIEKNIYVGLSSKYLQANANGRAYTEVKIRNIFYEKIENIFVTIENNGATVRKWDGSLEGNSEVSLSLNLPARFSSAAIKRNIIVHIKYKDQEMEKELPVTIKRYNPVRSR